SSNNNRIKGNGVRGSKEYGILIRAARGNIVEANELLQNWVGLFLQGAQANTIKGNKAHENNVGIYLADSQGNKIMENVRAGLAGSLEGNKVEGNKD
ncbi:MAG: NosD domain-containing protein, partial [Candidatus Bipolaricaulia bacterium]